MDEIIEVLEDRYLAEEVVELLHSVLFTNRRDNQIRLKEYAISHNICPKCYSRLETHSYEEDRGEHFKEMMYETRCSCCSWVEE